VLPLVQLWTGSHFTKTTLQSLGLVIQLCHEGARCPLPSDVYTDFVIVHISGIHTVSIRFCNCHQVVGGSKHAVQLLRFSCLPATVWRPHSAFTFDVLTLFHALTLQGKVSAFDFYHALSRMTDGANLDEIKVSLTSSSIKDLI